jgi:hypothetical protein
MTLKTEVQSSSRCNTYTGTGDSCYIAETMLVRLQAINKKRTTKKQVNKTKQKTREKNKKDQKQNKQKQKQKKKNIFTRCRILVYHEFDMFLYTFVNYIFF